MFEHRTAAINGLNLHYVTNGQGPLMLFLHGFPEFWYAWKEQLSEFGRDHQAVALDMRGYNLSDKPQEVEQYQMFHLIEDVRQLIEHLGAKTCVLVAHDWGGAVAWVFAMRYPELLEKLVIINSPHPLIFQRELHENPAQQQASQYMLHFRKPEAEQVLSSNNPAGNLGGATLLALLNETDQAMYRQAWSQPGALTGGLNYYRASALGPPAGETATTPEVFNLPKIAVPTLVIWGEQDKALLIGNLNGLDQVVTDITIQRIPDGSHWVVHEHPELINSYIRAFIRG